GRPIAVLQDLAGPKLRLGALPEAGLALTAGETCNLSARTGGGPWLPVPHPEVVQALAPGQHLYLGDGQIDLLVEAAARGEVRCRVVSGGTARSRMGINVPFVHAVID